MTEAIASVLKPILTSEQELISLDHAPLIWKQRIENAIADQSNRNIYLVSPQNKSTLARIIQQAYQHQWQIIPCGSGSKLSWGGIVKETQLIVSTQSLDRIIEHAVGDLTVTVEAGVKLTDLQKLLQQQGQFLPLDPAYPEEATIGGIIAVADTGSWRQRYGGVRDLLLGISFVRADGEIAKAGGKVVKNVAGYDLMKLFTGSYGTLGVISSATFRVYPLPEKSGTLLLTGDKDSIATISNTLRVSSLTPTAAEIVSQSVIDRLGIGSGMGLIVRFQSIAESIQQQSNQLQLIANKLGLDSSFYQDTDETSLWQQLLEIMGLQAVKFVPNQVILAKIGVIPNASVTILEELNKLTGDRGLGMVNVSSGLGKLSLAVENAFDVITKLRSLTEQYQGYLTILEAPVSLKEKLEPWGYTGNAAGMMQTLKQKFDPQNILSPGRLIV